MKCDNSVIKQCVWLNTINLVVWTTLLVYSILHTLELTNKINLTSEAVIANENWLENQLRSRIHNIAIKVHSTD